MSTEQQILAFEARRPLQSRFTGKLETLIRDLLESSGLTFHIIESRTKDVQSFREKLSRPTKSYDNPLDEITDLSGIRIITYYQDDADRIGNLIGSEFIIDAQNSLLHKPEGAEFGYSSKHYVIQLPSKRAKLAEWSELAPLKAEIQVRTVLQHAWAAVSHKLQYKREDDVPIQLRRKLFRLSALFELADDEFISLRRASGEVIQEIKAQLGEGNHGLPIDIVSLSELLESSPAVAEIDAMAAEVGFIFGAPDNESEIEESFSAISGLVHLCALAKIQTVGAFEAMLDAAMPWAKRYLRAQFEDEETSEKWYVSTAFICQLILIGAKLDKLRVGNLYQQNWNHGIANRVFRVAERIKADVQSHKKYDHN